MADQTQAEKDSAERVAKAARINAELAKRLPQSKPAPKAATK